LDGHAGAPHHAPVRVLPHVKKLDDVLGDFIVRVTCPCGTCRHIEPESLDASPNCRFTNNDGRKPSAIRAAGAAGAALKLEH